LNFILCWAMLAVVIVLRGFVMVSLRKKHPEKDTPV
jgi:hypothetical protein